MEIAFANECLAATHRFSGTVPLTSLRSEERQPIGLFDVRCHAV